MRILVAGESGSIHATRFLSLLQELGHEARLFVCPEWYWQEEHLHDATVYVAFPDPAQPPQNGNRLVVTRPWEFEVKPGTLLERPLRRLSRDLNKGRPRADALIRVLRHFAPDLVISLKMQDEGYVVGEARERMGDDFPSPWIHFCWGTDIEFFGKHPEYAPSHRPRIERALGLCDYLLADTRRDLEQAAEFGFRGEALGAFLAHGGFDLAALEAIRARHPLRDLVLVKGRQGGYVGKAMNILRALHGMAEQLGTTEVAIIMPTPEILEAIRVLPAFDGIRYRAMGRVPYEELLALHARARIAVSATDVDGTPSFLVEAMAMGALPVHSDMPSVREWVTDGENGLLFPVDDVAALRQAMIRGLADDGLAAEAARHNRAIAAERMDRARIGPAIDACLQHAAREGRRTARRHGTAAPRNIEARGSVGW